MSDQPTTGEWTADTVRRLEFDNTDRRYDAIANAHNAALDGERRRTEEQMDARHRRQLDEGIKQLAAERDKSKAWEQDALRYAQNVDHWKGKLAAEREQGVKALAERSFELHECQTRLTAEREKLREERAKFHGDDYADMDAARNRILDLEAQLAAEKKAAIAVVGSKISEIRQLRGKLAAEREKYQRSQEKVREYFDLLAVERERTEAEQ